MNYRQLGNTGIQVSEIGMGCWGIGGDSYGKTDDKESITTLYTAFNNGITFFDTADIYGDGHSEELIGRVFNPGRHNIIIATKVGALPHTGRDMPYNFSAFHLQFSLTESLQRLNTDYIDLYQLHSPPLDQITQAVDTLEKFQQKGLIRFIGVSCKSPDDALIAIQDPRIQVIQVNFNMIDQRALDNGLLAKCQEQGVGVIARTPLAFGFLTGRYKKGVKFEAPDHRANWSQEQIDVWAEARKLFFDVCTFANMPPIWLALAFSYSHPTISTTIPGMMTPQEVIANTSIDIELRKDVIYHIESIYNSNNFFIGE